MTAKLQFIVTIEPDRIKGDIDFDTVGEAIMAVFCGENKGGEYDEALTHYGVLVEPGGVKP